MSDLVVEVCRVDAVRPHPSADRLEVCEVKGWKTCAVLGQFKAGDRCVFFPPDSILPTKLSDRLNITKYLSPVKRDGEHLGGRVRVANLRGFKSYGTIMVCEESSWEVGRDVAGHYGVAKWEPPPENADGDAARPHPAFHTYCTIENWRNFPNVIADGTEVVITEKLHGKNARVGLVRDDDDNFVLMAGSHGVRRKEFDSSGRKCQFWECMTEKVRLLLYAVSQGLLKPEDAPNPFGWDFEKPFVRSVVVFGELYGRGVQDMAYGLPGRDFRAFDIAVDGVYLDFDTKSAWCEKYGVPTVPVLYRGPFSVKKMEEYVDGPTTMCKAEDAGKFKGREGVVITPAKEMTGVRASRKTFDRVVLKCVSFDYMNRKDGTEFH